MFRSLDYGNRELLVPRLGSETCESNVPRRRVRTFIFSSRSVLLLGKNEQRKSLGKICFSTTTGTTAVHPFRTVSLYFLIRSNLF